MSQSQRKIVQYLNEAHASETGLTRTLQAQIAMTPAGSFRTLLTKHLGETKSHAERLHSRIQEIDGASGFNPLAVGIGMAETVFAQALAIGKTPLDLVRGSGGEEKVLKNAKDDCAAEALEIATYTALERLADTVGDDQTAKLAASIRTEEEHMLERLLAEIPRLTEAVAKADLRGKGSYEITKTGAADTVRAAARTVKDTVDAGVKETKRTARQARRVPGVAAAEGEIKGALADVDDLAIADYDDLTAVQIGEKLPGLSQVGLAEVDAYERKGQNRTTVLSRIATLRGTEPWPGYDDQTVEEIAKALRRLDDADELAAVRAYEQSHKDRITVVAATDPEPAGRR